MVWYGHDGHIATPIKAWRPASVPSRPELSPAPLSSKTAKSAKSTSSTTSVATSTCRLNAGEAEAVKKLLRKTGTVYIELCISMWSFSPPFAMMRSDLGPFMLGLSVYGGWFAMRSWLGVLVGPLSVTLLYLLFVMMTTSTVSDSARFNSHIQSQMRRPTWRRGLSHRRDSDWFTPPRSTGSLRRRRNSDRKNSSAGPRTAVSQAKQHAGGRR